MTQEEIKPRKSEKLVRLMERTRREVGFTEGYLVGKSKERIS